MAIGTSYDEQEVVEAIANALETFYGSLIEKIDGLDIVKIMKLFKSLDNYKIHRNINTGNNSIKSTILFCIF